MTEEILPAPDKILTLRKTSEEQLVAHIMGNLSRTDLSDELQAYVDMMYQCRDLIQTWGSRLKVEPILVSMYAERGMTRGKANSLFDRTQRLFGTTIRNSQPFWIDIAMSDIKTGMKGAKDAGDWRSYAQFAKLELDMIEKFFGSADALMYDDFEMQPFVIGFYPEKFKRQVPADLDQQIAKLKKIKSRKEFGEKVGQFISYEDPES
jgi:hypothetical protein